MAAPAPAAPAPAPTTTAQAQAQAASSTVTTTNTTTMKMPERYLLADNQSCQDQQQTLLFCFDAFLHCDNNRLQNVHQGPYGSL